MYFADMTPYTYFRQPQNHVVLNIGWLDKEHEYTKGSVAEEVLETIFELCKNPVNITRGAHSCQFCAVRRSGCVAVRHGIELGIGGAEIRVPGASGVAFASPCMIYHYIEEHSYKPPQEFIDGILALSRRS